MRGSPPRHKRVSSLRKRNTGRKGERKPCSTLLRPRVNPPRFSTRAALAPPPGRSVGRELARRSLGNLRSGFSSKHALRRYLGFISPGRSCRKGFTRSERNSDLGGSSCKEGRGLWPCHGKRSSSACAMSQPMISALSSIEPSRPERPPWPASISVLNKRSCASALLALSRATHFAGSA